jgi:hypothetical protein
MKLNCFLAALLYGSDVVANSEVEKELLYLQQSTGQNIGKQYYY